jgi:hypothetical protein
MMAATDPSTDAPKSDWFEYLVSVALWCDFPRLRLELRSVPCL